MKISTKDLVTTMESKTLQQVSEEAIQLINDYWKFDDNQQPVSNWHDKQDLIDKVESLLKERVESQQKRIEELENELGKNNTLLKIAESTIRSQTTDISDFHFQQMKMKRGMRDKMQTYIADNL